MRIKIYQIDENKDFEKRKFKPFKKTIVDPSIYKNVFYGDVEAETLEDVFYLFNTKLIPTHQGHSLSISDVVEVFSDETDVNTHTHQFYYCNSFGFKQIEFDTSKCAGMDGIRVVYVTPNYPPLDICIVDKDGADVVGGYEKYHYNNDGTLFVMNFILNTEAELSKLTGSRKLSDGHIIVGPFYVCGTDKFKHRSLTDDEVSKYMNMFAEPATIGDDEVNKVMMDFRRFVYE